MKLVEYMYGEGMKFGRAWLVALMTAMIDTMTAKIGAWNIQHSEKSRLESVKRHALNLQQAFRACGTQDDYLRVFCDLLEGKYNTPQSNWDPRGNAYFEVVKDSNDKMMSMIRSLVKAKRQHFDNPCPHSEQELTSAWRVLAQGAGFPDHLTLGSGSCGQGDFTKLTEKHGRLVVAVKELLNARLAINYQRGSTELRIDNALDTLAKLTDTAMVDRCQKIVSQKKEHIWILLSGMAPDGYLAQVKGSLTDNVIKRIQQIERDATENAEFGEQKWSYIEPLAALRDKVRDCRSMHDLIKICEDIHQTGKYPREFCEALHKCSDPSQVANLIRIHSEK